MAAFVEEVDLLVGKNHLLKRGLLLIKAWWFYESRAYTRAGRSPVAHALSSDAVAVMVIALFNLHNTSMHLPLHVLAMFFHVYSSFPWDRMCCTIDGPVPLDSLHDAEFPSSQAEGSAGGNRLIPKGNRRTNPHQTAPNRTEPHRTKPNPITPHQTTPNHTKPRQTTTHRTTDLMNKYSSRYSRKRIPPTSGSRAESRESSVDKGSVLPGADMTRGLGSMGNLVDVLEGKSPGPSPKAPSEQGALERFPIRAMNVMHPLDRSVECIHA